MNIKNEYKNEYNTSVPIGFCYKQREALHLDVSNLFNVIENSNFLFSCFLATQTSLEKK